MEIVITSKSSKGGGKSSKSSPLPPVDMTNTTTVDENGPNTTPTADADDSNTTVVEDEDGSNTTVVENEDDTNTTTVEGQNTRLRNSPGSLVSGGLKPKANKGVYDAQETPVSPFGKAGKSTSPTNLSMPNVISKSSKTSIIIDAEIIDSGKKPKAEKGESINEGSVQLAPPASTTISHGKSGKGSKNSKKSGSLSYDMSKSGKGFGNFSYGMAKSGKKGGSSLSYNSSNNMPKAEKSAPSTSENVASVPANEPEESSEESAPEANTPEDDTEEETSPEENTPGENTRVQENDSIVEDNVEISDNTSDIDVTVDDVESRQADETGGSVDTDVANNTSDETGSTENVYTGKSQKSKSSKAKYQTLSPTLQPSPIGVDSEQKLSKASKSTTISSNNKTVPAVSTSKPTQSKSAKPNKRVGPSTETTVADQGEDIAPGTPTNVNYSEVLAEGITFSGYSEKTRDSNEPKAKDSSSSASIHRSVSRILLSVAVTIVLFLS